MYKIIPGLIVAMLLLISPPPALAVQKIALITEVQTGSEASASEEFVEIFNTTASDIDISGWALYYKSATGNSWSKKAIVASNTILQTDDFWIFSANLSGDTQYSGGLSSGGGNIQIRDKDGGIVDQFGWGSGDASLSAPAAVSAPGQSMYRLYDYGLSKMVNTDNNFDDFDLANSPTPGLYPLQEQPEIDQESVATYPRLQLSELYPNPASPQTDTQDEFIEIYNPNEFIVDLSGWKLQDDGGSEYIIKSQAILPKSWLAIFITESKITLNNSGDIVRLLDPNGHVNDESANYGVTEEGLSWSHIGGLWQWAVSATPGAMNSVAYIDTDPVSAVANVKKATAKKSTKKSSSPKAKASKVKSTTANSAGGLMTNAPEAQSRQASSWWGWLLMGLGAVTIGYGIYEYRTEIHILFKKIISKLGIGAKVS